MATGNSRGKKNAAGSTKKAASALKSVTKKATASKKNASGKPTTSKSAEVKNIPASGKGSSTKKVTARKGAPVKSGSKKRAGAAAPVRKDTAAKKLMPAPKSGVTVRMYRQGLGDCFLLAFPTGRKSEAYYMLIDCGLIIGGEPSRMVSVVNDIKEATGGNIHLLVVTHEHWDHVSGFIQAEGIFRDKSMRVHNVWFAWTEDPDDELAEKLRKQFDKEFAAVALALERAGNENGFRHIENVMSFFGARPSSKKDVAEPAKGRRGTREAMDLASTLLRKGKPRYCHPSDEPQLLPKVWGIPEPKGIRLYVLGPPHDEQKLRRINPTVAGKEVYEEPALTARTAFMMALHNDDDDIGDDSALRDLCYPFDGRLRISAENASHHPFFRKYYGFNEATNGVAAINGETREHGEEWRRIDSDWLGAAGELALRLDSYTNNTSLVLAIELPRSQRVLLFAADAQVGNWLSWDDCSWKVNNTSLNAADLLARTVFYKVGHHGSHNATVRGYKEEKKGLELMTHPDLVAMIPVDQEMATMRGWGKMPFAPLMTRLQEKTRGRVIRMDQPIIDKPAGMSAGVWSQFKKNYRYDQSEGLYLEYTVEDEKPVGLTIDD